MEPLIVVAAVYLPIIVVVAAVVAAIFLPRSVWVRLAAQAVGALVLAALLLWVAGSLHFDPRPFVVDPRHPALVAHSADNGFPSDHMTFAGTVALLVLTVRRRVGAMLLAGSLVGGFARVAANLHHVQDIIGGLLIALLSVAVVVLSWDRLVRIPLLRGRFESCGNG